MIGIMRELRFEISSARTALAVDRVALFATVPGETHTLGITMAADLCRDHGWRIDLKTGLDHDSLLSAIKHKPYANIGLSAGHPNMIGDLTRIVLALRLTHPLAHILVSG